MNHILIVYNVCILYYLQKIQSCADRDGGSETATHTAGQFN